MIQMGMACGKNGLPTPPGSTPVTLASPTVTGTPTASPTITPTPCLSTTSAGETSENNQSSLSSGDVFTSPITIPGGSTVQVKDVRFMIQAAQTGAQAFLGIYTSNGAGTAPVSLLVNAFISYGTGWNTAAIPFVYLQPGNYWLAISPYQLATEIYGQDSTGKTLGCVGSPSGLPTDLSGASFVNQLDASNNSFSISAYVEYCP